MIGQGLILTCTEPLLQREGPWRSQKAQNTDFQWSSLLKQCPSCIPPYMQCQARETLIFTSTAGSGFFPQTAFCWLAQPSGGSNECGEVGSSSSLPLLGCLGPIGVLQGRGGDNEMKNNFLATGREHTRARSSHLGCSLTETGLAKHTASLLLPKTRRHRCSVTLDQC